MKNDARRVPPFSRPVSGRIPARISGRSFAAIAALLLGSETAGTSGCSSDANRVQAAGTFQSQGTLTLVREKKLSKLLTSSSSEFEASGVVARGTALYVVFDNRTEVGIVDSALSDGKLTSGSIANTQYEGITIAQAGASADADASADPGGAPEGTAAFYVVKEVDADGKGKVLSLDANASPIGIEPTDVAFADDNKGFEGVAWVRTPTAEYLLALCEGNFCTGDTSSTGQGRVKVLAHEGISWVTKTTLEIPPAAAFADYSDLALFDDGSGTLVAAVVSQEGGAVWIGGLTTEPLAFVGPGEVYELPKAADGSLQYCTVEGVTFLSRKTLAMVSDKSSEKGACRDKAESIHVFTLP